MLDNFHGLSGSKLWGLHTGALVTLVIPIDMKRSLKISTEMTWNYHWIIDDDYLFKQFNKSWINYGYLIINYH